MIAPLPRVVTLQDGATWTRYSFTWTPGEALCEDSRGRCYPVSLNVAAHEIELHPVSQAWSETIDWAMSFYCLTASTVSATV